MKLTRNGKLTAMITETIASVKEIIPHLTGAQVIFKIENSLNLGNFSRKDDP